MEGKKKMKQIMNDKDSTSCKCGCNTYTHRHSNWIECTNCHLIKTIYPAIEETRHNILKDDQLRKMLFEAYKSGFACAVESLQAANDAVQKRKG